MPKGVDCVITAVFALVKLSIVPILSIAAVLCAMVLGKGCPISTEVVLINLIIGVTNSTEEFAPAPSILIKGSGISVSIKTSVPVAGFILAKSSAEKNASDEVIILEPSVPEIPVEVPSPVSNFLPFAILTNLLPSSVERLAKGLELVESTIVNVLAVKLPFAITIGWYFLSSIVTGVLSKNIEFVPSTKPSIGPSDKTSYITAVWFSSGMFFEPSIVLEVPAIAFDPPTLLFVAVSSSSNLLPYPISFS